jgi:plasmid stabilization system protein ParE
MPSVVWTRQALLDARRLHAFLAEKDPEVAGRAIDTLMERVTELATFPRLGRLVPNTSRELRELLVLFGQGGYIVRYRRNQNRIAILAVRHGREKQFAPTS